MSSPATHAPPGDHSELVLLTTRPLRTVSLSVRMRLGLVVVVRAAGRIVRRLEVVRLRARPHRLELLLANRGNVTETITGRCASLTVRRSGRRPARLYAAPRRILPQTRSLLTFPLRGRIRGRIRVSVTLSPGPPCTRARTRAFVLRLPD